jgi:hypothetical protein
MGVICANDLRVVLLLRLIFVHIGSVPTEAQLDNELLNWITI